MALVQIAHGGHKSDAGLAAQLIAQFADGGDNFHKCIKTKTFASIMVFY
jgi:hypothetical protein